MTKCELIHYCLTYPSAYEDYPFDETTAVLRHIENKKMFALVAEREGIPYINLKCDPMEAEFLRNVYKAIIPGWHMNKIHWNTIHMGGDVPIEEIYVMIQHSFDLTKPKAEKLRWTIRKK